LDVGSMSGTSGPITDIVIVNKKDKYPDYHLVRTIWTILNDFIPWFLIFRLRIAMMGRELTSQRAASLGKQLGTCASQERMAKE